LAERQENAYKNKFRTYYVLFLDLPLLLSEKQGTKEPKGMVVFILKTT